MSTYRLLSHHNRIFPSVEFHVHIHGFLNFSLKLNRSICSACPIKECKHKSVSTYPFNKNTLCLLELLVKSSKLSLYQVVSASILPLDMRINNYIDNLVMTVISINLFTPTQLEHHYVTSNGYCCWWSEIFGWLEFITHEHILNSTQNRTSE